MSRANATVRDVARVAKVSTATVSRVLNQVTDLGTNNLDARQADGVEARTDIDEAGEGVISDFRQSRRAATPRVSPRTRAKVLAAAELLDYRDRKSVV